MNTGRPGAALFQSPVSMPSLFFYAVSPLEFVLQCPVSNPNEISKAAGLLRSIRTDKRPCMYPFSEKFRVSCVLKGFKRGDVMLRAHLRTAKNNSATGG